MTVTGETVKSEWVLRAEDLCLGYGRRIILDRVNFELCAGDFAFLLGENGCGKSTLMHALLGDLSIQRGNIHRNKDHASARHVGFVPQRRVFDESLPMTVEEFMDLGLIGLKLKRGQRLSRCAEALDLVGLNDVLSMSLSALSGGMRQRVVLARALARRPRLLYLDEPSICLDVASTAGFWRLLRDLHRDRALTILCISHDPWAASKLATQHLTVTDGSILVGPPEDLLAAMER